MPIKDSKPKFFSAGSVCVRHRHNFIGYEVRGHELHIRLNPHMRRGSAWALALRVVGTLRAKTVAKAKALNPKQTDEPMLKLKRLPRTQQVLTREEREKQKLRSEIEQYEAAQLEYFLGF